MKKNNKKGFTLAELLIVVAIIAVLVAIAIPIFTSQLEKSREAVDASNIRAKYAEVVANKISGAPADKCTGTVTLKQQEANWQNSFDFPQNLKSASGAAQPTGTAGQSVTVTATEDGAEVTLLLTVPST